MNKDDFPKQHHAAGVCNEEATIYNEILQPFLLTILQWKQQCILYVLLTYM
jgi:hypothetical protein